jgi:hypothetical protein
MNRIILGIQRAFALTRVSGKYGWGSSLDGFSRWLPSSPSAGARLRHMKVDAEG